MLKRFLIWIGCIGLLPMAFAQIERPVTWAFDTEPGDNGQVIVNFTASIDQGWHLYSQFIEAGGPVPTSFTFEGVEGYELVGSVSEAGNKHSGYDETFKMDLSYFDTKATFSQAVSLSGSSANVKGYLEFMVCNDEKCLPPEYVDFDIPVEGVAAVTETPAVVEEAPVEETPQIAQTEAPVIQEVPIEQVEEEPASSSLVPGVPGAIVENPVSWSYSRREAENGNHELVFTATIQDGWKIYGQDIEPGGPVPTEFFIEEADGYSLIGTPKEIGEIHEGFDDVFEMDVTYYNEKVEFVQEIKFDGEPVPVKGELVFMTCEEGRCLPPEYVEFNVGGSMAGTASADDDILNSLILSNLDLGNPQSQCIEAEETGISFWGDFFKGFLGGLIALLTPCVFPMIPLTVSFFTKSSSDKTRGMINALTYGMAIFLIYALASAPFHLIQGIEGNFFNVIATDPWINLGFFAIFVVFALSFFGYYEITLPSGIANRANAGGGVTNLIGIFFMALTLCIVSFSCTGPILGSLVAMSASGSVSAWNLTAAMGGFGIALALPFGLFAAFPGWLNTLPKSGGWLTTVKVVLGFVELALAVKFLSNADLVEHWGILKRETFFLLWIIIGIATILYLLGKIKFPHDAPVKKITRGRWIAIGAFALFTVYLIPGLTNTDAANRKLLSGFPPPMFYSWYEKDNSCPLDLPCYKDFEEGVAAAEASGKPIMIDFTGWACVNCRRMEENVWINPEVFKRLSEEYVLISLYVDDRKALPDDQKGQVVQLSTGSTKKLRTVGDKWAVFQEENFQHNTQPLYALISPDGELLNNPVAYTPDENEYLQFLDCGLAAYAEKQAMAANQETEE